MDITLDKIASVTRRLELPPTVTLGTHIPAERGTVVVVEALEEKAVYGELELVGGRLARIITGDRIAGVLGERQALKGFVGAIPTTIAAGDTLHILNMGGVIGLVRSANSDVGQPLRVRVLGTVLHDSRPLNLAQHAIPWQTTLGHCAPIILISGTCMNAGKTTAACEIIRLLKARGYRLAGAKVTGVATQRDLLQMQDHGVETALSFSDAGLPSTTHTDTCVVPAAKGILAALSATGPDAIIVEFGDGIMGHYGVELLLRDRELMRHVAGHVLCANDLVAAWGGLRFLGEMGLTVDCISGPATDNSAGIDYITRHFGMAAANGRSDPTQLADLIEARVFAAPAARQQVVAGSRGWAAGLGTAITNGAISALTIAKGTGA